jgi:hypothetical protein
MSRDEWPEIMTVEDCQKCLSWGRVYAYEVFNRPDFPVVDRTKKRNKQVTKQALWAWLNREVKQ